MFAENEKTEHNRTIRITGIPSHEGFTPPAEMLITINYTGGSSAIKGIFLDNVIIPEIIKRLNENH